MLLTVEGGGFFSSSASGYSKGLALLFDKGSREERAMRVSPLAQYQLVDGGSNSHELRPDSGKDESSFRGCASFICYGRATERVNEPPPPKADTVQEFEAMPANPSSSSAAAAGRGEEESALSNGIQEVGRNIARKSCLKKEKSVDIPAVDQQIHVHDAFRGAPNEMVYDRTETRRVQWTDEWGKELSEIKEFEPWLSNCECHLSSI